MRFPLTPRGRFLLNLNENSAWREERPLWGGAVSSVPRLFLSYAREDEPWKCVFERFLMRQLAAAVVPLDYAEGDGQPFGPIKEWVSDALKQSAVFVAFLSIDYINKKYPRLEWSAALDQLQAPDRKHLIFVPLMLDNDAINWWAEKKRLHELAILGSDYAFSDYTDNGRPALIDEQLRYQRRIVSLASVIKRRLNDLGKENGLLPPPGSNVVVKKAVVLLGHPTAASRPEINQNSEAVLTELIKSGIGCTKWKDGWTDTNENWSEIADQAWFVQPVERAEASRYAGNPQIALDGLRSAMGSDFAHATSAKRRIVLWLPKGLENKDFDERAKLLITSDTDPILRRDEPSGLTNYLREQIQVDGPAERVPVVQLESQPETDYNIARVRNALHEGFQAALQGIVVPAPYTYVWENPEAMREQFEQLPGDRLIVAVHDLAMGEDASLNRLATKLSDYGEFIAQGLRDAGRPEVQVFQSVMSCKRASCLATARFPRWECGKWYLLQYETAIETPVRPRPRRFLEFRGYLQEWMLSSAA